jgi:hypothetical protein
MVMAAAVPTRSASADVPCTGLASTECDSTPRWGHLSSWPRNWRADSKHHQTGPGCGLKGWEKPTFFFRKKNSRMGYNPEILWHIIPLITGTALKQDRMWVGTGPWKLAKMGYVIEYDLISLDDIGLSRIYLPPQFMALGYWTNYDMGKELDVINDTSGIEATVPGLSENWRY